MSLEWFGEIFGEYSFGFGTRDEPHLPAILLHRRNVTYKHILRSMHVLPYTASHRLFIHLTTITNFNYIGGFANLLYFFNLIMTAMHKCIRHVQSYCTATSCATCNGSSREVQLISGQMYAPRNSLIPRIISQQPSPPHNDSLTCTNKEIQLLTFILLTAQHISHLVTPNTNQLI